MANFLQLCQDVRSQASISGDGPANTVGQSGIYADVVRWVAEAYNDIQSMHENWNFLYSLSTYTLPINNTDYPLSSLNVRQLAIDSFLSKPVAGTEVKRIEYISWTAWRLQDRFLDTTTTDRPRFITETPDGKLRVWPKADQAYEITWEGYLRPDVMVDSTDEPIFPAQYHKLIKDKALMTYGQKYNSMEVYQISEKAFMKDIKNLEFSELPKYNLITPVFV